MSESQLQHAIMVALKKLGFWAIRINSGIAERGGRRINLADAGTPDILVLKPYGFLEVKTPNGIISKAQMDWHYRARRAGIHVDVVRSVAAAVAMVKEWSSM